VQVIKKAKDSALRGGISGAIAMVANGAHCHITFLYRNVISKCPLVLIFFPFKLFIISLSFFLSFLVVNI
jgi:hypothetical protein